jgi:hypothetical protein
MIDLDEILALLKRIENYCTTPHWTANRRWLIEQTARELRTKLEKERALDRSER